MEPDQHLQLPPAGGRRDAGPGDRLRDGERDRGARRGPRARAGRTRMGAVFGRISFFVNAGVRFVEEHAKLRAMSRAVGGARPRALRRHRRAPPALPLRRAGQLARPHRVPAREQRPAHRPRGAGGDAGPRRARPRDPAAGLERGARPAAPVGPAVVAAHPAGPGLRDRPARVPRHLRGLEGHGRPRRRAAGGRARRDGRRRRARRRGRGRGLHEGRARRLPPRAAAAHRGRRADRRRPQPVHRDRAVAAACRATTAAS